MPQHAPAAPQVPPAPPAPPVLGERFEDALQYAARLHRHQVRKGTAVPYVTHLLAVAGMALEHGADEDTAVSALLHDAVEDQGGALVLDRIRERFGDRVAAVVLECSDSSATPKPPWRQRKEAYLLALPAKSDAAHLVSICDKIHNARSTADDLLRVGPAVWDRFNAGAEGQRWYYAALVGAFRQAGKAPPALVEALRVEVVRLGGDPGA